LFTVNLEESGIRDETGWLAVLAAVAAAVVYVGTPWGIGLSPDAVGYVSAARSFAAGNGFSLWDGQPMTWWPPLYPATLGSLAAMGLEPVEGARLVNAILFAILVYMSGSWVARRTSSTAVAVGAAVAVLCSPTVVGVTLRAWSETLFVVLCLGCLIVLGRGLAHGSRGALVWAAILAAAAAVTRYTGVALIAAACVSILILHGGAPRRRVVAAAFFGLIASLPLSAWLLRNRVLTGGLTGARPPSEAGVAHNALRLVVQGLEWVFPPLLEGRVQPVPIALVGACLVALLWSMRRGRGERTPDADRESSVLREALVLPIFVCALFLMLLVSGSMVQLDEIGARFTVPGYAATVLFVAVAAGRLGGGGGPEARRTRSLGVLFFVLWLGLALPTSGRLVAMGRHGLGYQAPEWRASELAAQLRERPPAGRIFSNSPAGVYILAGIPASNGPIHGLSVVGRQEPATLLAERDAGGEVYLAWFHGGVGDFYYTWSELLEALPLEVVAERSDGVLARIR
jgi:hypothetical protein